jgi:hypothetical protein
MKSTRTWAYCGSTLHLPPKVERIQNSPLEVLILGVPGAACVTAHCYYKLGPNGPRIAAALVSRLQAVLVRPRLVPQRHDSCVRKSGRPKRRNGMAPSPVCWLDSGAGSGARVPFCQGPASLFCGLAQDQHAQASILVPGTGSEA